MSEDAKTAEVAQDCSTKFSSRTFDDFILAVRDYARGLRNLVKLTDTDNAVELAIHRSSTDKYYTCFRFMRDGQSYRDRHSVYITSEYGGRAIYNVDTWHDGKCVKLLKYNDGQRCLQVVFDKIAYYLAVDYEVSNHSAADGRINEEDITKRKVDLLYKVSKRFGKNAELSDTTPDAPDFRDAYRDNYKKAVNYEIKHRIKYQDTRRVVFERLQSLMDGISSEYGAYATGRIDATLAEYPYDDASFAEADVVDEIRRSVGRISNIATIDGELLSVNASDGRAVPYVYFAGSGASGSYLLETTNGDGGKTVYRLLYRDPGGVREVLSTNNPDKVVYTIFDTLKAAKSTIADDQNYQALMEELRQNVAVDSSKLMSGADESEQIEAEESGDNSGLECEQSARELSFTEKKQFAKEIRDAQADLVALALNASGKSNPSDIYIYLMMEGSLLSYNVFYVCQNRVVTLSDAEIDKAARMRSLKAGISSSKKLRAVYVKWGQPVPTETKMHYSLEAKKLDCVYSFDNVTDEVNGRTAATSFADWRRSIALAL